MTGITDHKIKKLTIQLLEHLGYEWIFIYAKYHTLTALRDTLLPKLMSGGVSLSKCGEIRVSKITKKKMVTDEKNIPLSIIPISIK